MPGPTHDINQYIINCKPTDDNNYKMWHVESLLNQAADLLDRSLLEMQHIRGLEAAWELLKLDISEADNILDFESEFFEEKIDTILGTMQRSIDYAADVKTHIEEASKHSAHYKDNTENEESMAAHASHAKILAELTKFDGDRLNLIDQQKLHRIEKRLQRKKLFRSKKTLDFKRDAMGDSEALNYLQNANNISKRVINDFQDAFDRMTAASKGLKIIYDYTEYDLSNLTIDTQDPISIYVTWVRDAIRWLSAFKQNDQAFSLMVSIKSEVPTEVWNNLIDNSSTPLIFNFHVPVNNFDNHDYIRLKGIACFILGDNLAKTPWSATLALPRDAHIRNKNGDIMRIDQNLLPRATLGRIENRSACRIPELVGAITLVNTSIFGVNGDNGKLTLDVNVPTIEKELKSKLEDIQLEFILVGQPI
ncbi:MAG: hypothetical protein KME36_16745 [Candidatus Thiodiazotropha sp. (ex Lucina pensylvanica)]|nr:hypothetical protein [Candidatus Thiodiazotropha sp. (ex Lucina pensylvanica)]MBT3052266.1 hypothetical protein [Candidatus Thiodiazotropha sp. (ex Codakia orbicularis)]